MRRGLLARLCLGALCWTLGPAHADTLSLDQAVDVALRLRPEQVAAQAAVARDAAGVRQMQAAGRPGASVTLAGVTGNVPMIYTTVPSVMPTFYSVEPSGTVGDGNLMVMAPLSTGGRIGADVSAARSTLWATQARQAQESTLVARSARQTFLKALLAGDAFQVWQDSFAQAQRAVTDAQAQFRAGRTARVDLLRAQAQLAEVTQSLNTAHGERDASLSELRAALGLPQDTVLSLDDHVDVPPPPPSVADLRTRAEADRPDLQAARRDVDAAKARLAAARARYAPQIYAVGMAQGQADVSPPTTVMGGSSVGVVASLPVLDGGERRAEVDAAAADERRLEAEAERVRQQVDLDVTESWQRLTHRYPNVALSEPAVESAEEGFRLATLRFQAGRGIQLQVLDALTTLVRARLDRLQARYDYAMAEADLLYSLGRTR